MMGCVIMFLHFVNSGEDNDLFHHPFHQCAENVNFRAEKVVLLFGAVKDSIYCPELQMLIFHLLVDQFS